MRIGLVGYGVGGRYFHAPFIEAADGCEFVGVVARAAQRVTEVHEDLPGMPVFGSLGEMLDVGVDAVAISTPPQTRRELVLEAIGRGVHVVADKPFAPTAADGQDLVDAAAAAGVLLNVFHNRRWDTDITTLRGVLDSGALGDIWRFDSRFDLDQPQTLEAGPAGGLLRDLGSHLVDQALWLFGPAQRVSANLDWVELPEGRTDAGFVIAISHDQRRPFAPLIQQGQPGRVSGTSGVRFARQLCLFAVRRAGPGELRRTAPAGRSSRLGLRSRGTLGDVGDR